VLGTPTDRAKINPWAVAGPSEVEDSAEPRRTQKSVLAAHKACTTPPVLDRRSAADELACKPDPVPGRLAAVPFGGHPSRSAVADGFCATYPQASDGPPSNACCLALLRVGFTEPSRSPGMLVVSYTAVSPLPRARRAGAVCSLWHCPAGHPGLLLATTLPCGVRTFLGGTLGCRRDRPASSSAAGHHTTPPRRSLRRQAEIRMCRA
jgi:hypothetical protein